MIIRLEPTTEDFPLIPGKGFIWKLYYAWFQVTTTASEAVVANLNRHTIAEIYAMVNTTIDNTSYSADGGFTNNSTANNHTVFYKAPIITYNDGIDFYNNGTADTSFAFKLIIKEVSE